MHNTIFIALFYELWHRGQARCSHLRYLQFIKSSWFDIEVLTLSLPQSFLFLVA